MRVRPVVAVLASALVLAAAVLTGPVPAGASLVDVLRQLVAGPCASDTRPGAAHCALELIADGHRRPFAAAGPTGYGPADLQAAYGIAAAAKSNGASQTIAVVDAYDDGTAEADLATYRSHYGLPACTTANGCFRKVNQRGVRGSYPPDDVGWAIETSLDLDAAGAACPRCHLLLVEGDSDLDSDLYAADDTAVRLGAHIVSDSWGGPESSGDPANNSHFKAKGVAFVTSAGDSGYGVSYPAASPLVTSVGGTTLARSGSGFTETAWAGTGSGCSTVEAKPSWQHDRGCSHRTVGDVAVDADPNTGVSVYDSDCDLVDSLFGNCFSGWATVGGTSLGAPLVAGMYALAGNAASVTAASYAYAHPTAFRDVTRGADGSCGGSYLCTATTGYDGPSGLGAPRGTAGF